MTRIGLFGQSSAATASPDVAVSPTAIARMENLLPRTTGRTAHPRHRPAWRGKRDRYRAPHRVRAGLQATRPADYHRESGRRRRHDRRRLRGEGEQATRSSPLIRRRRRSPPGSTRNLPQDTVKDFAGIAPLGGLPNVLVISPDKNIRSVQALVATARNDGLYPREAPERRRLSMQSGSGSRPASMPSTSPSSKVPKVAEGRACSLYFSQDVPVLQFIREGKLLASRSGAGTTFLCCDIPTTIETAIDDSNSFLDRVYVRAEARAELSADCTAKSSRH